jgi:outer membrane protein OmpA-like peptidoglycan-associated protein
MKLSQDRAEAVRDYLGSKGVDAGRLQARGFGPDRPVEDNGSAAGREKNRRVEFAIPE